LKATKTQKINLASFKEEPNKREKVDTFDTDGNDDDYNYDDGSFIVARNNCAMAMDEVDGDCDTMMMPHFKQMKDAENSKPIFTCWIW
jgi:hypothetical protein